MRREWSEYDWGKWMSAVISRAARALTDTHSRWMTLIWEITECILTPRPSYRATITPDRWIGLSPTNHTARTVDAHTQVHAHTYTHTTSWQNEQIAASALPFVSLTLKFTWSLVSQGYVRREQGARVWTEIREINLISIRAADANAREFVSPCRHAHTVCMCAGIQIYLSKKDPHALYSHFVQLATFFTNSLSANNVCGTG